MIKSMTGFGKAEGTVNKKMVSVEIRSLNSKGMDVNIRLPDLYREKELEICNLLSEKLVRGKVALDINVESAEGAKGTQINKSIVKNYYAQLSSIAKEMKEEPDNLMEIIMNLPGVMKTEKGELRESEWKYVLKLIDSAVKKLDSFRSNEGTSLDKELRKRIDLILSYLSEVEIKDKERIITLREKLGEIVEELISKDKIDDNRFEQELIYYAEKLDITEEKVRLKTHCDFFLKTMNELFCGKKLGFISQELGREINTMGAKANDAGIQKIVVQMKDELEKVKEQLGNVL